MTDHLNNNLTETEIKIHTPDLDAIRTRLETAGAELKRARVHEHNVWYEDETESLRGQQIVLRLRKDHRVRLTYKSPPPPEAVESRQVRTRFEAEVEVDDFDTMDVILQRLGYHPCVVYEKYRTTYTLHEAEIVLDEMPFGNFIEVEGSPAVIDRVLAALQLDTEPRILTNYMTLFQHVKAELELDMHDLTFANFEQVHVPPDLFFGSPLVGASWGEA